MKKDWNISKNGFKMLAVVFSLAILELVSYFTSHQAKVVNAETSTWIYSYGDWYYGKNGEIKGGGGKRPVG